MAVALVAPSHVDACSLPPVAVPPEAVRGDELDPSVEAITPVDMLRDLVDGAA